ncbi:outer membrane lipoprotein carrier protein LolA [Planctomycetota bacterium]
MNKNNNSLDDALTKAIGSESIQPDFNKWQQENPQAVNKLTSWAESKHPPIIRTKIMKSKITKLATAAAIILAVVLSVTVLDKTTAPVWAIEETIEILEDFNAIHFLGTTLDKDNREVGLEGWARANEEQTASNHLRLETATGQIVVVVETTSYRYDPNTNVVHITEGYVAAIKPWIGAEFLESLNGFVLDWEETYGKDPATNRDRVFVTCSHPAAPGPRSWWFEFDIESKLLVSFKQWENMTREGTPNFNIKSITFFEDLPDELFDFEIPEGAEIVDATSERINKLLEQNAGMLVENMTEEQACKEIARRYWQAVIDQNWQAVAMLRPIATAEDWKNKYSSSIFEEIIEIGEPYHEDGCKLGKIVSCTIRFDNNVTRTVNMIILFKEVESQKSCIIAGTWGKDINAK